MTTAWTIRSRRADPEIHRRLSLSSLPDFSDNLDVDGRSGGLFEAPDWSAAQPRLPECADIQRSKSNTSVAFLGRRITREYRSSFVLSDDQMVGVTRRETFYPEKATADVRVSLSLRGPPDEATRRSHSAPSLIRDSIQEGGRSDIWAKVMLETDRPRDAEFLGRIGSRNYFSNANVPRMQKKVFPETSEENFVIERTANSFYDDDDETDDGEGNMQKSSMVSGGMTDLDPSTDRQEKDTIPRLSRRNVEQSVSSPLLFHKRSNDKDPPQTPLSTPSKDLPSTERSESFLHIPNAKSESILHTFEPLRESPSSNHYRDAESTLSLQTDLEYDPKGDLAIDPTPQNPPQQIIPENTSSTLSFVSATNGVLVRLGGPNGEERISSYLGEPPKRTVLHTTLWQPHEDDDSESKSGTLNAIEAEGMILVVEDVHADDLEPPKSRERRRPVSVDQSENEELVEASQTDDSQGGDQTPTQISTYDSSEHKTSSQLSGLPPQLPPRQNKLASPRKGILVNNLELSSSQDHDGDGCDDRITPANPIKTSFASPRLGKPDTQFQDQKDDDLLSAKSKAPGNAFRSPFDPRSDQDLVSSIYGASEYEDAKIRKKHSRRKGGATNAAVDQSMTAERRRRPIGDQGDVRGTRPEPAIRRYANGYKSGKNSEGGLVDDEDDETWFDEESRLRPPAIQRNLQAELAGLPIEDPATRTKRLRPLQFPLYANVGADSDAVYEKTKAYGESKPLRQLDQNLPDTGRPDSLVVRTRRRTVSGVTGQLPRAVTMSSSSIWYGDHPVPTKTQLNASEQSPLRLSNIQLQAQAEIARRRSRNNLAASTSRSLLGSRSRSVDRSLAASTNSLYGPTGRRVKGGAPLVERAIKRHMTRRDGYETLSVINIPRLEPNEAEQPATNPSSRQTNSSAYRLASEKRGVKFQPSRALAPPKISTPVMKQDPQAARSLVAQAAVDLAVHAFDPTEV